MSPGPTTPLAALSVDLEDYFQVESLRHLCPRDRWESFEDRTRPSTERVLELLARHGARATFFILGWTADRHPELIRRVAAAGHEIASHGYHHELITRQTPEAFREDVRRTKRLLEDLSGSPVRGYRAPSYTIVSRTLWALDILAEEGYAYDSSIFPIRRLRYGIPGAPRWPHRRETPPGQGLVEYPLPTVRFGPLNVPATGGAYLRLLPLGFQTWALGRMMREGRPFVVNVHPWEFDPGQPRLPVGPRTRWTHYHNLHRSAQRLSRILSMAPFRTQLEVLGDLGLLPPSAQA